MLLFSPISPQAAGGGRVAITTKEPVLRQALFRHNQVAHQGLEP